MTYQTVLKKKTESLVDLYKTSNKASKNNEKKGDTLWGKVISLPYLTRGS